MNSVVATKTNRSTGLKTGHYTTEDAGLPESFITAGSK
jgi:hypothetical protein